MHIVVDTAHWVGAIKRDADGSHMQLHLRLSVQSAAQIWWNRYIFWVDRGAKTAGRI